MATILLMSTQNHSSEERDIELSLDQFKAIYLAARTFDREGRSLARMKVGKIIQRSDATVLELQSSDRKKKNAGQKRLSTELQWDANDLSTLFTFMEQRAFEVANRNEKGPDTVAGGQVPASTSLAFALAPIDAANLALSRVQDFVTPTLENADGTRRALTLPPSASLVPPRKLDKDGRRAPRISGKYTGCHGISEDHAIVDDRISLRLEPGEQFAKGDLVTCDDDLVEFGRPIRRFRRQRRIPGCS